MTYYQYDNKITYMSSCKFRRPVVFVLLVLPDCCHASYDWLRWLMLYVLTVSPWYSSMCIGPTEGSGDSVDTYTQQTQSRIRKQPEYAYIHACLCAFWHGIFMSFLSPSVGQLKMAWTPISDLNMPKRVV